MPSAVYSGKNGVLLRLTRTGDNSFDRTVLGSFESWSMTFGQTLMNHTGPKDEWEYHTPTVRNWAASITRFVPSADATPSDDEGAAADADVASTLEMVTAETTVVVFHGKNGAGDYVTGNCHWESVAEAIGADADKETIGIKGTGEPTITKG